MKGVAEWLKSIGLSEYAQRFNENGVDLSVLHDLTEQDLRELGVLLGHRRKLLRAIADLEDAPGPKPSETATGLRRPSVGERRHLTVMFCDLVRSTAPAARLDPEDMRALIGAYHGCITDVIGHHNGTAARYTSDGALVYFGFPQAHEDDAEQAVRAALELVDVVPSIRNVTESLQIRIGIATGTVVVADLLIEFFQPETNWLTYRESDPGPSSAARPASMRATGTRNGEHDT